MTEQEIRIAQARRLRLIKRLVAVSVGLIAFGVIIFWFVQFVRRPAEGGPGEFISDQGAQHVSLGTPFEYNSNPPTSGPHFATPAEWGVYTGEIHDQILIHNLEHGGIWIAYRSGIASDLIHHLEAIQREFGRKVIMAPRAANDTDIALAAWNHLDKFSAAEFSKERVRNFIKAYRNRGPEFVP